MNSDDVDFDSAMVTQQVLQQQRQDQENRDRQMALQLSSQHSPVPSSSSHMNPVDSSAFARIMATERANSWGPTGRNWASPLPTFNDQTVLPSTEMKRESMPGSYDQSWDSPNPWDRSPMPNSSPLASNAFQAVGRHSLGANGQFPFGSNIQPVNQNFMLRNQFSNPALRTAFHPASAVRPAFNGTPWVPSNNGPSVSNIIQRTNMYDYSNGVDVFGSPLPGRLTSVLLDDDDYEPSMTGKELDDLLNNIRPDIDIPEHNRGVGPPGLKYPLYRHQEVALNWMKQMEEGTNKGGILADDMGLGKTISTLALMHANPAKSRPKVGPMQSVHRGTTCTNVSTRQT